MKKLYTLLLGAVVALSASATTTVLQQDIKAERAQISAFEISKPLNKLAQVHFENLPVQKDEMQRISPKENWVSAGTISYTDDIMTCLNKNLEPQTYDVDLEMDENDENHFRLVNPYKNWENPFSNVVYDSSKDYYIEFKIYDEIVIFEDADLGFSVYYDDAPTVPNKVAFTTQAAGLLEAVAGLTPAQLASVYPDIVANYVNGVITYPVSFYDSEEGKTYTNILVSVGDPEEGYFAGNSNGMFQIVMPGGNVDPNAGWENLGTGTYYESIMSSALKNTPVQELKVNIQKSTKVDGMYRVVDPYKNWEPTFENLTYNNNKTFYMVIHCEEAPYVWIEDFSTGVILTGQGELKVLTQLGELCKQYGATQVANAYPDAVGTIKDNVITFPSICTLDDGQYLNFLMYTGALTDDTQFMGGDSNEFKLELPSSGINDAVIDLDSSAPVEYFNLQGVRIANPASGELVIKRQGETVTKTIVR